VLNIGVLRTSTPKNLSIKMTQTCQNVKMLIFMNITVVSKSSNLKATWMIR
jgi:hypothetical protein